MLFPGGRSVGAVHVAKAIPIPTEKAKERTTTLITFVYFLCIKNLLGLYTYIISCLCVYGFLCG